MDIKYKLKEMIFLALSVGIFVPIWCTFHSFIGINIVWAAFASAAIYFAAGHKLNDAINVAVGHVMGLGWGIAFFILLSRVEFKTYNSDVVLFVVLFMLGVLSVIVTHLGIKLISHLPSLFCGWAVAVGILGNISIKNWGNTPLDILFSLLIGVFFLGIGISQFQQLLLKLFHNGAKSESKEVDDSKAINENVKLSSTEAKMKKYTSSFSPINSLENLTEKDVEDKSDFSEIKREIIELKNSLSNNSYTLMTSQPQNFTNTSVKIVGICGSPHKRGSTVNYIKTALEAAESVGNVTVELIELAGKEIKPCMGCKSDKCYGTCRINDDMQAIYPILKECDGVIIGSPSYFGTYTGQLKLFIDRLRVMRHTNFQLGNKIIAPLAVAGRRHGGQEITNLDIVQSMMRHNTIIVNDGTAVCQLGATGWSHTFDDPNVKVDDDKYGLETAVGVGKRVAEIAKVIKSSGLQKTIYEYNEKIGKR
ncbi:MAG: NAD(P)H-dependent oxidoreductase [Solirubrobacterales bacterium]